jgi:hypothetical protein
MSPSARNPYPRDSPDHDAWDRWHHAYFNQPVSGQLYEIAAQLRSSVAALVESSADLMPPEGRRKLRIHVYALEAVAKMVQESAENADSAVPSAELSPE